MRGFSAFDKSEGAQVCSLRGVILWHKLKWEKLTKRTIERKTGYREIKKEEEGEGRRGGAFERGRVKKENENENRKRDEARRIRSGKMRKGGGDKVKNMLFFLVQSFFEKCFLKCLFNINNFVCEIKA